MPERRGGWIQTYSGLQVWPLDARPEEFNILDIAHALSNTARYGGHTREFYSVAQHSVYVSRVCDPRDAMAGLMHDASEAYLGDMPRPIKHSEGMEFFRAAERRLEEQIAVKFGVGYPFPESVHVADAALLATEKRDILASPQVDMDETEWLHGASAEGALDFTITPVGPGEARIMFLARWKELCHDRQLRFEKLRQERDAQRHAEAMARRKERHDRAEDYWSKHAPFTGTDLSIIEAQEG